jgi:polyferredoxin
MLRKIRTAIAIVFFILIMLLFLDFTGTLQHWFGWLAKIQFLPAVLALNVGVVLFLVVMTLILGRVYCSVICPLGVYQDIISWIAGKRKKNRFHYSSALNWLRYSFLVLFIVGIAAGISSLVVIIEPYSAFGRIASNLFAPLYQWGNNVLAYFAERMNSYMFYTVDVWLKSIIPLVVAIVTFVVITILAWRGGRTYCNTICPVGTVLGFLSKFSLFKPFINTEKCNSCGLCARNCKAACIDSKSHAIDYSRCVTCMNCMDTCNKKAIKYEFRPKFKKRVVQIAVPNDSQKLNLADTSRRDFLSLTALFAFSTALKSQTKKVEGGLAAIEDKQAPVRSTLLTPPGSLSASNLKNHCTACQLCISGCPNQVLQPSNSLMTFMQPEMSYERGYCRPECVRCSEVCPTGAIHKITPADKSAIQIGHAIWIKKNCVVVNDKVSCGNCARHCPTGAIQMVPQDANKANSLKIPVVNTERCIGCGTCENLCPSRPFSAIYVEGHERHRTV